MNFKQLLDISNGVLVSVAQSMVEMGLDIPLIWTQMAASFEKDAKNMIKDAGLEISGNDVASITKSFANGIKSVGLCQRVNILEVSDSKLVIDLGECIYAPATKVLRAENPKFIPPCPMLAILAGKIETGTTKKTEILSCEYKPQENTSIFTLKFQ